MCAYFCLFFSTLARLFKLKINSLLNLTLIKFIKYNLYILQNKSPPLMSLNDFEILKRLGKKVKLTLIQGRAPTAVCTT